MSVNSALKELSRRIDLAREANHLTWASLARVIGCSTTTAYRYQKGEVAPDFNHFLMMALKLDVSLDWLIAGRGDMWYKPSEKSKTSREIETLLGSEFREMAKHMTDIPELRYEILALYHKFIRQNRELVYETEKE